MFQIIFYSDKNGKEPVAEYIQQLAAKTDKDSRIKARKINDYIEYLAKMGKNGREPFMKHLNGEIWELRPLRDRILFAAWDEHRFILLHYFMKDTPKAPPKEIAQAKRNLMDYRERNKEDEKQG